MTALFEAYDDTGKLQLTTEAVTYYVSNSYSVTTTSMGGGGYGQVYVYPPNSTDLVAFRCTDGINISGYRESAGYRFITQTPVCTIQIKILSLARNLSPTADNFGMQLFAPDGTLQFSAARNMSFFLDSVSVFAEDGIGDVGESMTFASGSNPYAVIAGSEYVGYTGADEFDDFERIVNVASMTATSIDVFSVTRNDWPSLPGGSGGYGVGGTYTVFAVS
jgi:hypothetical protein